MAIKGSLREASLPDVLQLLAMGQKTGCLSVTDRSNFGSIYFERGRVIHAMIVNRPDKLGDLLIRNGRLDPAAMAAAIEEQATRPGVRFGQILIERGAVTREQVEHYVRVQIEEAVYLLFTWAHGSFYFEADQRPDPGAILVSLNAENLLLEGARRIDEWSLIEKKIPSFDLVFEPNPANDVNGATDLTEEQRTVLPLLNGERNVREVVDESGLVEFDVGKAIFGLLQAGFVHPLGRRRADQIAEALPSRVDEHRNLGVAFYRAGMFEEAVREFRRVTELHPDNLEARFFLALVALRAADDRTAIRLLKGVAQRGGSRPSILAGISLALERLGRKEDARLAIEEALRLAPRGLPLLLSHAILLLKNERVPEAREAFTRYREVLGERNQPPAAYYAFAMLAEAVAGRGDAALRLGEEGLAQYPDSAPLLLHLGAIWERREEWEVAESMYRRAVGANAELAQAHKALGDSCFRRGAHDEAADSYRRAIEISPEMGDDVYFKLGTIHYKRMEREAAVQLWRKALELNPQNAVARTNLELVEKLLP
jgi:tetratricopeptide (TPR) repeat protein